LRPQAALEILGGTSSVFNARIITCELKTSIRVLRAEQLDEIFRHREAVFATNFHPGVLS